MSNDCIPEYNQIFYNEANYYLENKWNRKLTEHEKNVLKEGYNFGRYAELRYNEEPFLLWERNK